MPTSTTPPVPADLMSRLLQAVSPALQTEVDKVLNETRSTLQGDFDKTLKEQLAAAQTAASAFTASKLDELRKQLTAELQSRFDQQLKAADEQSRKAMQAAEDAARKAQEALTSEHTKAVKALEAEREKLSKEKAAAAAEIQRLTAESAMWKQIAEGLRGMDSAASQPDILLRFMKATETLAPSMAVYVAKAEGLALWKSRNKNAAFPEAISQQTADPEFFYKTITVRSKSVAAIYAAPQFNREALDLLAAGMEKAIEVYGLRLKLPAQKA